MLAHAGALHEVQQKYNLLDEDLKPLNWDTNLMDIMCAYYNNVDLGLSNETIKSLIQMSDEIMPYHFYGELNGSMYKYRAQKLNKLIIEILSLIIAQ